MWLDRFPCNEVNRFILFAGLWIQNHWRFCVWSEKVLIVSSICLCILLKKAMWNKACSVLLIYLNKPVPAEYAKSVVLVLVASLNKIFLRCKSYYVIVLQMGICAACFKLCILERSVFLTAIFSQDGLIANVEYLNRDSWYHFIYMYFLCCLASNSPKKFCKSRKNTKKLLMENLKIIILEMQGLIH